MKIKFSFISIPVLLISLVLIVTFFVGFSSDGPREDMKSNNGDNLQGIQSPYIEYGEPLDGPMSTLNESFEGTTFPPAGWVKVNVAPGATGWIRLTNGTTPVPGFVGGNITVPPGGGNAVAFCSYLTGGTTYNDQWLITPQLTNIQPNDSLMFYLRKFGNYKDNLIIRISTTTNTVSAMTIIVDSLGLAASDSGWVSYGYNIGSLVPASSNIYIGFRQWVTNSSVDGASFSLDLVTVTSLTGVGNNNQIINSYNLSQNYPNPFNPTTKINFSIPKSGLVTLKVYNVLGKEVASLVNEVKNAGSYAVDFDGSELTSGTYFYRIEAGDFTDVKKMILLK